MRTDLRPGAAGAVECPGGFENVALWHERDISHSSVERVILPDSTILIDYLLAKTSWLIAGFGCIRSGCAAIVDLTRGLIFSGQVLLDLAAAGMSREDAYRLVQGEAMQAWESEGDFRAAIEANETVRKLSEWRAAGKGVFC